MIKNSLKIRNFESEIPLLVGIVTFFFGFGIPALFNLILFLLHSPLVLNFRSSLVYISSIAGDGLILPFVNMFAATFILGNKELVNKTTFVLAFIFGLLFTFYLHIVQASEGLVNWSMPKPWEWNFLGIWHAFYMISVASLLSLYFIALIRALKRDESNRKKISKDAILIIAGLIFFFILLRLDYVEVDLRNIFSK